MSLPRYLAGNISGSTRGSLAIKFHEQNGLFCGKAIYHDQLFGLTTFTLKGAAKGQDFTFDLKDFKTLAPIKALFGTATVKPAGDSGFFSGNWKTDLGEGNLDLRSESISGFRWLLRNLSSIVWVWSPSIYCLILLVATVLGLLGTLSISYPALLLLLAPAPYILQRYLARIINIFGVRTLGPVQLSAPQAPLTGTLFAALDSFLALYTKVMLAWLLEKDIVSREEFEKKAREIGIGDTESTRHALVAGGCIEQEGEDKGARLRLTRLGKKYGEYCMGH